MKSSFESQLIRLKEEFFQYQETNHTATIPNWHLASILQKYLHIRPTMLLNVLSKSSLGENVSWDDTLRFLSDEIELRDSVSKLQINTPSTIEVKFGSSAIKINELIGYVKQKESNIMKKVSKLNLLGDEVFIVELDKEILFYNLQEMRIVKILTMKYERVIEKILKNKKNKKFLDTSSQKSELIDKVNPMSKRTEDFISFKSRKNTNNSDSLQNAILNAKKSKMESSICSDHSQLFRSVTDVGDRRSKFSKYASFSQNKKKPPSKMVKLKTNDKKSIFKLMTETPVDSSIEIIKAYTQSQKSFLNYMEVQKRHMEREKEETFKGPGQIQERNDFSSELELMRKTGKELTMKRRDQEGIMMKNVKNNRQNLMVKKQSQTKLRQKNSKGMCKNLENKNLEILNCVFTDNFLLISLINRQVRLYKLRKSIHSFSEELVFEKTFSHIVYYLMLYKSKIRSLYNFLVAEKRQSSTKIVIFELNKEMLVQKQVFDTFVQEMPIFQPMLPLGVGGFNEKGLFFMIQVNSPITGSCESKSIDEKIINPQSCESISISSCKIHSNLINIYLGSKDGTVFIFDRILKKVRKQNQVSHAGIKSLEIINDGNEVLFWDSKEKVGILNSTHLTVSYMTRVSFNSIRKFHSLERIQNGLYMFYGNKEIDFMRLVQNEEKKFENEKPIKVYNTQKKLGVRKQLRKNSFKNRIKNIVNSFVDDNRLILVKDDGQIVVYSSQLEYVGSYFAINFDQILQIIVCKKNKYLVILFMNNTIGFINIFSNEVVFTLTSKSQIFDIYFIDDGLFGYISQESILKIYNEKGKEMKTFNISHLSSLKQIKGVKFYSGELLIIEEKEVIILQRKTFVRNFILKLKKIYDDQTAFTIQEIKLNNFYGVLFLLISNGDIIQLNLKNREYEIIKTSIAVINISIFQQKQSFLYSYLEKHNQEYSFLYKGKRVAKIDSVQTPILIGRFMVVLDNRQGCYYDLDGKTDQLCI